MSTFPTSSIRIRRNQIGHWSGAMYVIFLLIFFIDLFLGGTSTVTSQVSPFRVVVGMSLVPSIGSLLIARSFCTFSLFWSIF